jgi:succinate-semialdehyde dehydrogenase/glutarate-semialdehyde dehydrogenase
VSTRSFESIDPTSGKRIRVWSEHDGAELERRLDRAYRAARAWGAGPLEERAALLARVGELLRARIETLALLMAEEVGKPLAQGRAEVEKCAAACDHYARHASTLLADEPVADSAPSVRELVAFRPLGVVLAIMPWNFPLWQVLRCAAPTLVAGNGLALKHAESTQGCAAALEALFLDAGAPSGLVTNLVLGLARIPAVIRDRRIAAVTLTGSTRAGRAVAEVAGAALKKCVLELGGSDPYVVLADAELALAAEACVASRLINGGQSCIAAKRFIVVEPLRGEFTERVVALMGTKTMGDPRTAVDLGPQARADLCARLHAQVRGSVERGARVLLGGEPAPGPGFFYPPSVLADVTPGQPAYAEELFGPVAAILAARDETHALELANDTAFGLGAALFTRDVERGVRLAKDVLQAGSVFVNDFVRSDPRLPFGGIKDSGLGRELGSFGVREFVNVKTVVARVGRR